MTFEITDTVIEGHRFIKIPDISVFVLASQENQKSNGGSEQKYCSIMLAIVD